MQISAEMELMNLIFGAIVFLITWLLPTSFVVRCRSRDDEDIAEGSICFRTVQFSNEHPAVLSTLEIVPGLLLFIMLFPIFESFFLVVLIITVPASIYRILEALFTKKYP